MKLSEVVGARFGFPPSMRAEAEGVVITSPEEAKALRQRWREEAGAYIFVSVWNLRPSLAVYLASPDGGGKMETVDWDDDGLLADAVEEAGGALNQSGWYPPNARLEEAVRAAMKTAAVPSCPRCGAPATRAGKQRNVSAVRQRWKCRNGHLFLT